MFGWPIKNRHNELLQLNKTARQAEFDELVLGELYLDFFVNHKLGAIKHQEFYPYWYPLGSMYGIGTYILVDHSPGSSGSYGRVIFIDNGRKAIVLADSIANFLKKLKRHANLSTASMSITRLC